MSDLFEFTVEWPSTSAQSVIVTGDFDQWSRSMTLFRSSANNRFMGTIKVPYGCPTRYKFIVDGEWEVKQEEPTELSPEGYLNNIYYVPVKEPLVPEPSTGANGTLASHENGNVGAPDTENDKLNTSAGQAEDTITTTPSPPMDKPTDVPVPATSEPTTSPTNDAGANPESNVTESPNMVFTPIIPMPIVPVNAKENCTIDPTKDVSNGDNIGTFVGVKLPPKDDDKKVEEEGKEEEKDNGPFELADTSRPVKEAPKEPPTEEAVKEEQPAVVVAPSEDKSMAPAPEPVTAVKTEDDVVPQPGKTEEPKKEEEPTKEEEPKKEDEPKKEEPQPEASSAAAPTPDAAQPTPKSPSRFVEGANDNANGHTGATAAAAATSDNTSTAVKPTSSPTISSTAPGTTLAESTTSGVGSSPAAAPGNKTAPVPEHKSTTPSGVNNGDTKEFGVKEGKGSTKSGKKRKTSILGTLKRIFHGDKHKKTNGTA